MKRMTRVVSLLLAVVMVLSMAVLPASAAGFRDVKTDAWYAEAVDYVTARGYMAGTGEDTFAPNAAVTRAMFVTVLAKMAGAEIDNDVHPFEDVPAGTWYSGAVAWAAEQGIVSGTGAGKFSPNKNITRQDMSLILANFVMATGYKLPQEGLKSFTDADKISAYAREAVDYGTSAGLMSGYSDGTFRPAATATRAQLAVIVMALDKKVQALDAEPVPMPAQSFEKTASGIAVGVKAPVGAVPAGTELQLGRVTDTDYLDVIGTRTGADVLGAVDISFMKDGAELEPERAVEVEISMAGLEAVENPAVVHVKDDGTLEYVSGVEMTSTRGARSLKFKASDFSVYVIIGGEGGEQMLTVKFYQNESDRDDEDPTKDHPINVQVIRLSQLNNYVSQNVPYVFDPGVPEITAAQSFEGWKTDDYTGDVKKENLSVDEINTYIGANYTTTSTGGTLNYYAMVFDVFYVIYHDQAGAILKTEAVHKELNATSVSAYIHMTYVPFKNTQNFAGWTADINVAGDEPTYQANAVVIQDPSTHTFTVTSEKNEVHLYPYLNSGHWLSFDNYISQDEDSTSGSYTAPVFIPTGTNPTEPDTPTRSGYTFGGWYTDKSFGTEYNFNSQLTKDTKVFAKWIPDETSYMVVYMIQNATDANDTDVTNNTYSYYDSVRRDWKGTPSTKVKTGEKVTAYTAGSGVNDKYLSTGDLTGTGYPKTIDALGQYFKYSDKNNGVSTVVKGDGTSILYVYYDRMEMTIRLHYGTSGLYSSVSSSISYYNANTRYFRYDNSTGKYVPLTLTSTSSSYPNSNAQIPYQYAKFTDPDGNVYYDGNTTFYTFNDSTTSTATQQTLTGLYGAAVPTTVWPDYDYNVFHWGYRTTSGSSFNSYTSPPSTFAKSGTYGSAYEEDYYLCVQKVLITSKPIHAITQNPETGEWGTPYYESDANDSYNRLIAAKLRGHKLVGYNVTQGSMTQGYQTYTGPYGDTDYIRFSIKGDSGYINISGDAAYVYYELNQNNLIYNSLGDPVRTETLRYGQSFAKYEYTLNSDGTPTETKYIPTNAGAAYEFLGWYYDEGFTQLVDFENDKMPDEPVNIYAKWMMKRFRIVLDPTGGDTVDAKDIVFPGGTQATTFRVDYGELVAGGSINNAHRKGYTLLGWYLDPEYTIPFNFNQPITDAVADMTYRTATGTARQGDDPWTLENGQPKTYDDNGKPEVVGKVTIYAKWREDPKGTIGAHVVYDAQEGKFASGDTIWTDPYIYADNAEAFAQPASTPNNTELQFLYWQIMKPTSETDSTLISTGKKAYPGQIWDVLVADAVQTTAAVSGSVANPTRGAGSVHPQRATNDLLTEGFESTTSFPTSLSSSGWTAYNAGSGNNWKVDVSNSTYANSGNKFAYYEYSSYYAANCYLISAPFTVNSNATGLSVSLYERVYNSSYNETFEVYFVKAGDLANAAGVTSATKYTAIASANYTNTAYAEKTGSVNETSVSALKGQSVRLVIHCTSASDHYYLFIDDITVTETVLDTCTVHFEANGGTGTMADEEVLPGARYQLPACGFTAPEGKKFAGWKSPTGVTRDAGDYVIINDDITFEAQWEDLPANPHTVTVTYVGPEDDTAFVTPAPQSEEVGEGQLYTIISPDVSGYTPDYDAVTGTMGTENLTFTVTYTKDVATNYTVYLHAVYGRANTTANTHIYWYANNGTEDHNGAGVRHEDTGIDINAPVTVPTPTSFSYKVANRDGETTVTGLIYRGHEFLGWARLNNQTGADEAAHPELDSVEDCWLIWHEDSSYEGGGYYTVNETGVDSTAKITEVAADEMRPYHDLYAVWAPSTLFYVFHSATGKLEAIDVNDVKGSDGTGTYNLTSVVTPGYLYGGYYKQYGYISAEQMQTVVDKYEKNASLTGTGWTASTTVVNNVLATYTVSAADAERFKIYDCSALYTNGTDKPYTTENGQIVVGSDGKPILAPRVWESDHAYKEANGDAKGSSLVPEAGEVYYLKEVPESYLTARAAWTLDLTTTNGEDGPHPIKDIFLFTVTDDNNYQKDTTGFKILSNSADAAAAQNSSVTKMTTLARSFKLIQKGNPDYTANGAPVEYTIDPAHFGVSSGYIAVYQATALATAQQGFTMIPSWTTPDGITVTNDPVYFDFDNDSTAAVFNGGQAAGTEKAQALTWRRVYDGKETMYFDFGGGTGVGGGWLSAGAKIVVRFCGTNTSKDVRPVQISGTVYGVTVPAGDWDRFLIIRCSPALNDSTLEIIWEGSNKNVWNQTWDIPLLTSAKSNGRADLSANFVTEFHERYEEGADGTKATWAIYPTN